MQAARAIKRNTAVILNLVLTTVKDKVGWTRFASDIGRYVADTYGVGLPPDFGEGASENNSDIAAGILVETLGEERAVLAAYRIAEELLVEDILESKDLVHEKTLDVAVREDTTRKEESISLAPTAPADVQTDEQAESDVGATSPRYFPNNETSDTELDNIPNNAETGEENIDVSSPSSIDSGSTDTSYCTVSTVLAVSDSSDPEEGVEQPAEDGQPDGDPDGGNEENASDTDSGYYSADGGRAQQETASLCSGEENEHDNDDYCSATRSNDDSGDYNVEEPSVVKTDQPFDPIPAFRKCFQRQAFMLTGAIKDALNAYDREVPLNVESVQFQLERYVFNPDPRIPPEYREVRYNFYPPFMHPRAIANYHIFAVTTSIPVSCKANRSGSELLKNCRELREFKRLPRWRITVQVDDSLGEEVVPITELTDTKLVPLKDDVSRLQWAKMRGEHIRFFSYPSLHMPPKITRMLMETLLQPFADENDKGDLPPPCISDEELKCIVDPSGHMKSEELSKAINRRRTMVTMAVRFTAQLELMERVLREPSSVKKIQEVLHHTFHHGYVSLVRETAKVNLSNYATYHGITYNDPLNNCTVSKLMEGKDKEDYIIDSVYLFLVLNWQTAMGMWQQAIDETTIQMYTAVFAKQRRAIYSLTSVTEIGKMIIDILMDGDRLTDEMRKALPNFITQSQISDFRHFLTERSNVPTIAAPFYPSDFVPLAFRQSAPLLWDQVYLLQIAFYIANHGGYLWEPPEDEAEVPRYRTYCPCNLCSPHRMPLDNIALHNEVLAINTFEIRTAEGKSFKLTPELWANAYLDKFVAEDFHPFTVCHYTQNKSLFTKNHTACVTESPEILALIRQIQTSREEFLLTRGKGLYKDPETGETIASSLPSETHPGAVSRSPISSVTAGGSGGIGTPSNSVRSVRAAYTSASACRNDRSPPFQALDPSEHRRHGSENDRREEPGVRRTAASTGGRERCSVPYEPPLRAAGGARIRRRKFRKSGFRGIPEHDIRGGGGGGRSEQGEYVASTAPSSQTQVRILSRNDTNPSGDQKIEA
ncbi:100K [turkey adenovirus 4]|uniref:Shutoff protein n=1 Tax=turkey adenovirus 4 TaxID=1408257 RepID=U5NHP3_9ADEN|nr:100K [Turkey aviadenovirus 4]AGX93312.1 100K [Turkey aviadenovirus 4]